MGLDIGKPDKKPAAKQTFTVRDMIARLAQCEDMDAEVSGSFCNSDPMPISDVAEEDGVITLTLG